MDLSGNTVAFLVENNYQTLEFWYPYYRMKEVRLETTIVGPQVQQTYQSSHNYAVKSEVSIDAVDADQFDALIIPGGYAPDKMRTNRAMINLVTQMHKQGKPIAAICHATWVLISAGILKGKKVTGYHSIKDDIENAGAQYIDEAVVCDGNLITSRQPDDLPFFCPTIISMIFKHVRI